MKTPKSKKSQQPEEGILTMREQLYILEHELEKLYTASHVPTLSEAIAMCLKHSIPEQFAEFFCGEAVPVVDDPVYIEVVKATLQN